MLGATAMPPAGHLRGAEIRLHGAPGLLSWGRKVSDPSSPLSGTTCFTKIMQQSGCSSRMGQCLTPKSLRLVEMVSLTLEPLGQANDSNNSIRIVFMGSQGCRSHQQPPSGSHQCRERCAGFLFLTKTPVCTQEVFPPLPMKGSCKHLYCHHSLC